MTIRISVWKKQVMKRKWLFLQRIDDFENRNMILIDKLNRFIDRNEIDKGCENYMRFQYESKWIHLLQIDMNDK